MGKNKRNQKFRRDRRGQGSDRQGGQGGGGRAYFLAPKESKSFEQYYKGQGIVPEGEFEKFIEKLKQPLPCTFRVTGFTSHSEEMLHIIKGEYLKQLVNIEIDGKDVPPAKCLSWYPDELAWQLDLERKIIRKDDSLKRLHKFLIQETESGNISRQEAVSMVPPLLLNVKSHHKVLDMCAAPGSKTAQLIEMLHIGCEEDKTPDGYVIANDSDNKRCYLMVHQISRLASPQFLVTNMDASNLPNLYDREEAVKSGGKCTIRFDRILCDVPCSGDGTLRKNVDAWHKWNPNIGHGLHNLQVRILCRGLNLLSDQGRLVYSTCSFNPVENEAVLVHVLKAMNGKFRLVDVSDKLPGLDRDKGMLKWKIMSKEGDFYEKYEDIPERLRTQIPQSAFPPTIEEARELGLDRCLRILPHKQNTGGFFVAVIERTVAVGAEVVGNGTSEKFVIDRSSSAEASAGSCTTDNNIEAAPQVGTKRKLEEEEEVNVKPRSSKKMFRYMGYKEDPFFFIGEESEPEMWPSVRNFFGIKSDFPIDRLMLRCEQGRKRNVYYVASGVKDLVQENKNIWKFINLGVKILSRSESKEVECDYRLVQDGLHLLYPYITQRIVKVSRDDIVTLLSSETPFINRMTKAVQHQMNDLSIGSCVFVYECETDHNQQTLGGTDTSEAGQVGESNVEGGADREGKRFPQCKLVLCGWRGKVSCRSFLPKNERAHYLRLCGVEMKEGPGRKNEKSSNEKKLVSALNDDNPDNSAASTEINNDDNDDDDIDKDDDNSDDNDDVNDDVLDNDDMHDVNVLTDSVINKGINNESKLDADNKMTSNT